MVRKLYEYARPIFDDVVDISNKSRYDYYKYKGEDFAYDKKDCLVIRLYKEDDGTFTEITSVGLRPENWKNKAVRNEYLDEWIEEMSYEAQSYADDFLKYELPYLRNDSLNESFFTPPDLKAVLKFLKKLNQCVDELSDFDTNKWLNRNEVLPILDDSREYLSNMFKYYKLLIQGW